MFFWASRGVCPACDRGTVFLSLRHWLRDHFRCVRCKSLPRERALMHVLTTRYPRWRSLRIHESSPCPRGASARLQRDCPGYVASQFFPEVPPGQHRQGVRCENLEQLTFADASVDLHVTQDVMEHLFDPAAAFREIARTLAPGGAHVFTAPLVNKHAPSVLRARRGPDGGVEHLLPPVYHGNPIDDAGSLVTMDWGFDIVEHIARACGLATEIITLDDVGRGIRAEFIEVLVTTKPLESATVSARS